MSFNFSYLLGKSIANMLIYSYQDKILLINYKIHPPAPPPPPHTHTHTRTHTHARTHKLYSKLCDLYLYKSTPLGSFSSMDYQERIIFSFDIMFMLSDEFCGKESVFIGIPLAFFSLFGLTVLFLTCDKYFFQAFSLLHFNKKFSSSFIVRK